MGKASKPLRRLVLEGRSFLWKVEHRHLSPENGADRCREIFTAFVEGEKRSPLRIWFTADGRDHHAGYPEAGVVWTARHRMNINEPHVARRLIEVGLAAGWMPTEANKEFVIEDGFAYVV